MHFYALREDLLPVLQAAEEKGPLRYTRTGNFIERPEVVFHQGAQIPNLGLANSESAVWCDCYLVVECDTPIQPRYLGPRTLIDQLENPDSVTFSHGGYWLGNVVLHGRVDTASVSPKAKALMHRFRTAITRRFQKVGMYWVGPQAMDLFRQGARFTIAVQSPPEFDLADPS